MTSIWRPGLPSRPSLGRSNHRTGSRFKLLSYRAWPIDHSINLCSLLKMLHAHNALVADLAAAAGEGGQDGSLSPSKTLSKHPMNLGINPHHPAITARTSSTSTASAPSATTPTSPRPSATDLTCIPGGPGTIVIGYRGTFAFGRDGLADVKFRKLTRILVHGRVSQLIINS